MTPLKPKLAIAASIGFITLGAVLTTNPAQATPLRLDYIVKDTGSGLFNYDFKLSVDNNDGSYLPSQTWNWIVFGDAQEQPSPLTSWVGDLSDSAPFITSFSTTSGYHNGPTLYGTDGQYVNSVLANWTPTGIGDFLKWSGTSNANLLQGDLLFTTLQARPQDTNPNFGVGADFKIANRVKSFDQKSVPEPTTLLGLLAVVGLGGFTKKKLALKKR